MSNVNAQISNEIQSPNTPKKNVEEWNDGTLEYWVSETTLGFSCIIPSFRYSAIRESSFPNFVILTFICHLKFDIWISD
jgi:hypothetical protein